MATVVVVVNWLVQSMLHTAAMMLVQLAHKPTKLTNPTNPTYSVGRHIGTLTVEWAGSGKPVGQYGGFQISVDHTVVDLLDWLAQQDEHLVDARLFVGQGGPEVVVVDDCIFSTDSVKLAKRACLVGPSSTTRAASSSSLSKLVGLVGLKSLVVTGGQLHQIVQSNQISQFWQSSSLQRRLLRACQRRWCSLTADWATTVLRHCASVAQPGDCSVFVKLASLVVKNHSNQINQCQPAGSIRLLVAAIVWLKRSKLDLPLKALAACVKAHLENSDVVNYSCSLLRESSDRTSFYVLVPALLSRLDLVHCAEQLGEALRSEKRYYLGHRVGHLASQIAASKYVPDLAKLASTPAGHERNVVGSRDWWCRSILYACAEHIRPCDLSAVVLAGWNGQHYQLLSELAKHHSGLLDYHGGFDKAFFDIGGPQLALQRFMVEELQAEVADFLLSIWEPEHAGPNRQHPAWACFGASIRNMWAKKYRLYYAGGRAIVHLLGTNPWVRKAFRDSRPEGLAKHILASNPPSWLEHHIRCALLYSKKSPLDAMYAALTY